MFGNTTKTYTLVVIGCISIVVATLSCRTAPITGRRQLLLVPEAEEISLGLSTYQQVVADESPSTNQRYIDMVNRVGHRIARVANRPDYQWEFRVVASPQKNAFALPGGKVVVYEGIIPICESEAGLAVVMSHEVAHVLARHGGERMSHGYMVNGVGRALSRVMKDHQRVQQERVMQAFGIASQYGFVLPYSRKHESEADHMGILLMAQAGYDPREAPRFWQRFADSTAGQSLPDFLSTHPADDRRASELSDLLAEAIPVYEQSGERLGLGEPLDPPGQPARYARGSRTLAR